MRLAKPALLTSMVLLICTLAFSQTQPSESDADKEKKKKELDEHVMQLLDQSVSDANTLRQPQNRAVVYAISADLYWKFDEKRARELFRNAAAEILVFNQDAEKERRESTDAYGEIFDYSGDPRGEILPLAAKHDAELALEMLLQTRSARLADAIAKMSLPGAKSGNDMYNFNPDKQRVNQEVALEQQFALLAADENPEKAIKLIKDSLAKGISANVLPLLQKLWKKDEKKGGELAGDVIKKLLDTDLSKSQDDMRVALRFLQFAFKPETPKPEPTPATGDAKEKPFKFSDSQVKDLATKIADTLLQPSTSILMAASLSQAMPLLEKFVPERMALLKQRETESLRNMPPEFRKSMQSEKLWDANSTPEDILGQLPKLQNDFEKAQANEALIMKIGQLDDDARAKKLIDQITDDKTRSRAQEQFEAARIGRSANAGKLDEARKLIGNLTKKKTQIQRLVALAVEFQKKGGEKDIANAKSLMKDARALTNENPESDEDLADFMEVVKGYATVDADVAFRMFEPVVDQITEYLQAYSVINKYNTRGAAFKKGELTFKVSGNSWDLPLFKYIPQMQLLGKADLDRMFTLADRFGRSDARAIVKLYVLQGFLKDPNKPDTPGTSGAGFIVIN